MILTVFDRLILLNVLPKEGDITSLKIVRGLREDLSFSEDEHKELELRYEGGNVFWKEDVNISKDINIGERAKDIIAGAFKTLNKNKKLTEQHLDLYERFVGGE